MAQKSRVSQRRVYRNLISIFGACKSQVTDCEKFKSNLGNQYGKMRGEFLKSSVGTEDNLSDSEIQVKDFRNVGFLLEVEVSSSRYVLNLIWYLRVSLWF